MADRRGLIVDYGGVLTTDVFASFRAFCEAEGLPPDTVRDRFRSDPEARELLAGLETGALAVAEFEPRFAALLEVESERLIERLFGGMEPDEAMLDGVRAARRAGVRTCLLSNSWGDATTYDPALLEELFDAWVISSEVGLRKPDPAIYELAAERLGLAARRLRVRRRPARQPQAGAGDRDGDGAPPRRRGGDACRGPARF